MPDVNQEPLFATIGELVGTIGAAVALFGGPSGVVIARGIALAGSLIARGVAGEAQVKLLTGEIQAMVDANVDPSSGQWQSLYARHEAANARIQASRPAVDSAP